MVAQRHRHFDLAKDGNNISITKTQNNATAAQIKLDHLVMRDCGGVWALLLENKTMDANKHPSEIKCTTELL